GAEDSPVADRRAEAHAANQNHQNQTPHMTKNFWRLVMKRALTSLLSFLVAILVVFSFGVFSSHSQQPAPKIVAVKAARALDTRTGAIVNNVVIVIEGDRIKEVGPNVAVPANVEVIDLGSKTILPGLIDCHTHLTFEPSQMGYSSLGISVPRSALSGA